jgi:hypothetical protein
MRFTFDLESAAQDHIPALLEKDCYAGNRLKNANKVTPSTKSFFQGQIELGTFYGRTEHNSFTGGEYLHALPTLSWSIR